MINLEKNKIYIASIIVVLVVVYFFHTWYVKKMINDEIKKIGKEHRKRQNKILNLQKQENIHQNIELHDQTEQQDMDSYIDPGNSDPDNNEEMLNEYQEHQEHQLKKKAKRVSKQDVLMRDMLDGSSTR